jgi:type VI secretion system protein ImpK
MYLDGRGSTDNPMGFGRALGTAQSSGELFKENWGGERFFDYLDEMLKSPGRFIQVLELFHICLSLGFTGKYRLADAVAGRHGLADVRERLYQVIRQGRPEHGWQLSDSGRGLSVAARQFRGFGASGS